MPAAFAEIHARSAFSFLRGSSLPETMVRRAAELEYPAIAITDHAGFYGSARAHQTAKQCGIRAIAGATIPFAGGEVPVLCATRAGYATLCRHLTDAKLGTKTRDAGGFAGLIALTGDREGPVAGPLARGEKKPALHAAKALIAAFGRENVYVEIFRHRLRDDVRLTRLLADLARHLKLPVFASNAPLHARRADRMLADAFACLRHHTTLDEAGRLLAPNGERHLKPQAEMRELFADMPEALENSLRLVERIDFGLEKLGYRFPDWHDGSGKPLSIPEQTTLLRRLTYQEAPRRFPKVDGKVRAQIEHEIALIHRLGFPGYFLIVRDIMEFARGRGILCQGRGSAANSAVCFALGITHVDPVGGGLLFERFLSENRNSWPDIDIDFPSGPHREEVIQYVYKKYGERGAAMTANVITYRPKSAFREMSKVLGLPPSLAEEFSKNHLLPWDGEKTNLPPVMRAPDSPLRRLYDAVLGLPRHLGQHSGGMIICDRGLDAIVPLQPSAMPDRTIVQWDKDDCEDLGIVKVDLLGLGMLAAMETALEISAKRGRPVDIAKIPKDDPEVFDLLCRSDTVGTFQVESRAQMATLPVMRPKTFYDVAIQVAIIRPGPIIGDLVHPYLNRRTGREKPDYIHPDLKPILERTLGVPLFQEQVLRMAMELADFNGAEADELRRAMAFKRADERMEHISEKLRSRMTARGIDETTQAKVIESIGAFAQYGFPESHAISFALIAYASCWLKVHRPAEFYAGLINHQPMGFYSVNTLIQDAKRRRVRVRPVSCVHSAWETTVTDNLGIRLGLHRLKGLRETTGRRIVAEREGSAFLSLTDFLQRVRPSVSEKRLLAAAGALNDLPVVTHRREALWQAELPLYDGLLAKAGPRENATPLAPMSPAERLHADLVAQGATTGPHPMRLWRENHPERPLPRAADLHFLRHGTPVTVAGLVICRQRPGTANGHCFISLEDETGIANLFVPKDTFEHHRLLITGEAFLLVHGRLQRSEGDQPTVFVTGLKALTDAAGEVAPHSRDFH